MTTTIKTRSDHGTLEFTNGGKYGCYLKVWYGLEWRQCMSKGWSGSSISSSNETIHNDARKWWAKNKNNL